MLNRILERSRLVIKLLTRRQMNILDMLEVDHISVEMSYLLFRLSKDPNEIRQIVRMIQDQVNKHALVEENFFYPACENIPELKKLISEAFEEHKQMKMILGQLAPDFEQKEQVKAQIESLMALVRHHVQEEENDLFPQVRKLMSSAELAEITSQVREARQRRTDRRAA
jgi:hemerythrin superfamily protein